MPSKNTSRPSKRQRSKSAVELTVPQKLEAAIAESLEIFRERLTEEKPRDAANSFLVAASNRFDKIVKPDFHGLFGYEHGARQIASNLKRINQDLSRCTLQPEHGRIDTVLNDLVSEVMRLAKSQTIFCESCEHCLRERYPDGDALLQLKDFSTEATLDAKTWAHIIERFGWPDELQVREIVVALRHIESLAWSSRPGAVKEAVTRLIDSIVTGSMNNDEIRQGYEADSLASVKRDIEINETDGDV